MNYLHMNWSLLTSVVVVLLTGCQSDEFDRQVNLLTDEDAWQVYEFTGTPRATVIDIGITRPDWLVIVPETPLPGEHNTWFQDDLGPLVYREVTGNFAVVARVRAVDRDDPQRPPDSTDFSAAGFVVRDPAGTHSGNENWIMYNLGGQVSATPSSYSREVKKTINSASNMFITDQLGVEELLLVCRVDDAFYFYYWADAIGDWRQEQFVNQTLVDGQLMSSAMPTGTSITPELREAFPPVGGTAPIYFDYGYSGGPNVDMPDTLQVGVMGGNWSTSGDVRAEFDFVRIARPVPETAADCTTAFAGLGNEITGYGRPGR
jgi:hypothetical protein